MSESNVTELHSCLVDELFLCERKGFTVQVEGRAIPRLAIHRLGDDQVTFILDERFAIDVPNEVAHRVAWMVANALAIGEGYPSLNATEKSRPFAPEVRFLGDRLPE